MMLVTHHSHYLREIDHFLYSMGVKKVKGLKIIIKKYESNGTAFNSWAMHKKY